MKIRYRPAPTIEIGRPDQGVPDGPLMVIELADPIALPQRGVSWQGPDTQVFVLGDDVLFAGETIELGELAPGRVIKSITHDHWGTVFYVHYEPQS